MDILQYVFSTAWQSVHRFEGRSSLYTWLYKLAINATFRSIRRNNEMLRDTINHWAHHRGQMTVYLRLMGAKVPALYGPSADDQRFL